MASHVSVLGTSSTTPVNVNDWANPQEIKTALHEVLSEEVEGSSPFACGQSLNVAPNPGLTILDYGTVGLPLSDHDAAIIVAQATQSPFGRREQTLVDTAIRKSWELSPSQFSLKNPNWEKQIVAIVDAVYDRLRLLCGRENVYAELYKLLLYEKDAFFKPHKDSEKAPGMFGTLVVSLPSLHSGGEICLRHEGETTKFDFATNSEFEFGFAAWYADITHEVLPVTSGRRIVLTYNLIRNTAMSNIPIPQSNRNRGARLSTILNNYNSHLSTDRSRWPPFLIHILAHQYTQASLRFDLLKAEDYEAMQCLKVACADLGFDLYLAILERTVVMDDDNDEEIETTERLQYVVDMSGQRVCDSLPIPQGSRLVKYEDEDADESEHEGWTGNEGATATYWYRDASALIVPTYSKLDVSYQLETKEKMLAKLRELEIAATSSPAERNDLLRLCELVRADFSEIRYGQYYTDSTDRESKQQRSLFIAAMCAIIDLDQLQIFDTFAAKASYNTVSECVTTLGRAAVRLGFNQIKSRLQRIVESAPDASRKTEFLEKVEIALREHAEDGGNLLKEFAIWRTTSLLEGFKKLELRKEDGVMLAELCQDLDASDIETNVFGIIDRSDSATRIGFLNQYLSKDLLNRPPSHNDFVRKQLQLAWDSLKFRAQIETTQSLPAPFLYVPALKEAKRLNKDVSAELHHSDVIQLLQLSAGHLPEFTAHFAYQKIIEAIKLAPKDAFPKLIIPLIRTIVFAEAPIFLEDGERPNELGKTLVYNGFHYYITKYVGREPRPPKDWRMMPGECNCKDCAIVNKFLRDPTRQDLDFPCGHKRRVHLNANYNSKPTFYNVNTIATGNPQTWHITKNRNNYKMLAQEWQKRHLEAKSTMKALAGRLKPYLEDAYTDIISAQVKGLPALKKPGILQPVNVNRTSPNTQRRKATRKANALDTENIEPKRLRSGGKIEDSESELRFTKSSATAKDGSKIEVIELD